MKYNEAIEYIHGIPKFVRPLGNANLGKLLSGVGNPQERLKFVHVAGTNGKGSVCAMTAEVLKTAGYRTGLFTSPFIEVFNERIQINNEMIENDVLAKYVSDISDVMERTGTQVSEFAFIFAVAMKYFADRECDIVVLETGMGGRLDATNIIPSPECAVLTSISLDHTQYLGDTIEEITKEKCGIIKKGAAVISAPNTKVASLIRDASRENELVFCQKAEYDNGIVIYKNTPYESGLKGGYQAENVSVVIEIISAMRNRGYVITDEHLRFGLKNARWMARYEFITPDIVIDGGHNPDGIRVLKESLASEGRDIYLLMAMMKDKSYRECIEDIIPIAKGVVATELDMGRCLLSSEIKSICDEKSVACIAEPDIKKAVDKARNMAKDGLLCVCGSLYLAGSVRRILTDL